MNYSVLEKLWLSNSPVSVELTVVSNLPNAVELTVNSKFADYSVELEPGSNSP